MKMGDTCDRELVTQARTFLITSFDGLNIGDPPRTHQSAPTLAAFQPWGSSVR